MRETGRCLEFPFQRREASVEWRGSMLPSVCEAVDPRLLKGGWCDSCPPLGPWDLRASQASPVLLAHWYRHSRRQVCSPNSCPEVEEVWMLNNRAVIGNWFVHLPTVWVKVSRWCLASYLPSTITSFSLSFFLSISLFPCVPFHLYLSPLSRSFASHSTCSSTKTRWRVMPATTIVCCATTRPRPSSTWSSMCALWSTNAVRASGSFSACRRACQRRRRTSAPSLPSANALLQIQVRTRPWGLLLVSLYGTFFSYFLDVFAYTSVSCTQLRIHMLNWEALFA